MALKRSFLEALGIDEQKTTQIIEAHMESVNAKQAKIDELNQRLSETDALRKELDELRHAAEAAKKDDYKTKYETTKNELDKLKTDITAKAEKTAKETAVREYLKTKSIDGANLEIAVKALAAEIGNVTLDNGKIIDTTELDGQITGTLKGLVSTVTHEGTPPANPPQNSTPSAFEAMTLGEKMLFANKNPDAPEVREWLKPEN